MAPKPQQGKRPRDLSSWDTSAGGGSLAKVVAEPVSAETGIVFSKPPIQIIPEHQVYQSPTAAEQTTNSPSSAFPTEFASTRKKHVRGNCNGVCTAVSAGYMTLKAKRALAAQQRASAAGKASKKES